MLAAALLLSASSVFAQAPAAQAPAPAAQPAVAVSSGAPEAVSQGVKVGGDQPAAVLKNPITVKMHKESARWEPVSVRAGGDPGQASNSFMSRVRTVTVKEQKVVKGVSSKATSVARLHPRKDDKLLIVSVYPAGLKKRQTYMEIRCLISENWLDEVKIAAVTVKPDPRFEWGKEDTVTLARKGIEFGEDFPAGGRLLISALDPKPGKGARNSGQVARADFGGDAYDKAALHVVSFSYSAVGVSK